MSWLKYHRKAELCASMAESVKQTYAANDKGDVGLEAQLLYSDASDYEWKAWQICDPQYKRTRSILAVSSVALLVKAQHYTDSIEVGEAFLNHGSLMPFAVDEITAMVNASKLRLELGI